jgi:hypothetical protein
MFGHQNIFPLGSLCHGKRGGSCSSQAGAVEEMDKSIRPNIWPVFWGRQPQSRSVGKSGWYCCPEAGDYPDFEKPRAASFERIPVLEPVVHFQQTA